MKKLISMFSVLIALGACSSDSDKPDSEPIAQQSDRTVVVYMSGENSLSSLVDANLKEMKDGSLKLSSSNSLVVFVDKSKNSELPWLARIQNGKVTDSVSVEDMNIRITDSYKGSQIIDKNGNLTDKYDPYASDPLVMEAVLKYAFNKYPSKNADYGLVLWGHSTGWVMSESIPTRAFGIDNGINSSTSNNGKWMNIPTMVGVLKKLPHLKFIFADCCLFMCMESLYELRDVADYIIGSPAEIPQDGAPYQTVVPDMFSQSTTFYNSIVDDYYAQKNGDKKDLDLPLTVVDMKMMDQLATATKTALQEVKKQQTTEYADLKGIVYYFYNDQRAFYDASNAICHDAGDFIHAKAPEAAYKTWKAALDNAVKKKTISTKWYTAFKWDTFYGDNFKVTTEYQSGLSMYVPQSTKTGHHATYDTDIKNFTWYNAVLK